MLLASQLLPRLDNGARVAGNGFRQRGHIPFGRGDRFGQRRKALVRRRRRHGWQAFQPCFQAAQRIFGAGDAVLAYAQVAVVGGHAGAVAVPSEVLLGAALLQRRKLPTGFGIGGRTRLEIRRLGGQLGAGAGHALRIDGNGGGRSLLLRRYVLSILA